MVVLEVRREDAAQVPLVLNDNVVDALSADAADHALDVWRFATGSAAR